MKLWTIMNKRTYTCELLPQAELNATLDERAIPHNEPDGN